MSEHKTTDRAVHMAHCNQGEWIGACKYGEDLECPAMGKPPAQKTTADHTVIRRNLRNLLDRMEQAHREKVPLTISSDDCRKFAWTIRGIQDVAAKVLGYE